MRTDNPWHRLPELAEQLPAVLAACAAWAAEHPMLLTIAAVCVLGGYITAGNLLAARRHAHYADGARTVTILPPPQVDPASAYDLWANLHGLLTPSRWKRLLYGTPHLVWQYSWTGRELSISLWVPGTVPPGAAEAAIRAAWPAADCRTIPAGPVFGQPVTAATGGQLLPSAAEWLPLAHQHVNDPLRPLMAAGSGLGEQQHAVVQILTRPAPAKRSAKARQAVRNLRNGKPATRLPNWGAPVTFLLDLFLPGGGKPAGATRPLKDPFVDRDVKTIIEKLGHPLWETAIRYVVASTSTRTPAPDLGPLRGKADAIASAFSVYTGRNSLGRRRRLPHPAATVTARRLRAGFLTSLPELAALAALPRDIAVPGLQRARAKSSPAPVTVPGGGRHLKLFGTAEVGGQPIAMTAADARYHMHVVGSTGSGKSTLLTNLILDDIEAGRGTVVIDPHGDLILDILERLDPDDVKNRLVLFDPDQPNPPRLNPLEGDPEDQDLIVDNLVGIFSSIFQKAWGPRMDDVMRVSCLTVMRQEQASMQMIPRLLNEDVFRASATQNLSDKAGLTDFWEWYSTLNPAMRSQVIGPVQARLRAFLLRDFVQQTMSASTSSFDMADVLDGGILLARLPKGTLGLETSRLMGSMLLAKVWQAASARAALPPGQRKDCSIYLDEAQNFLTMGAGVADMLAEARKYRLSMVLAHQNLGQFPRELLQAVAANARSKVFFSCSPGDASQLEEHTLPELDAHDLSHLDAYTAAARLMADGQQTAAFTLRTRPPRPEVGQLDRIREDAAAATPQPGHAEVNEMTDRLHDELDNGKKGRPPRPRQQRPKGTKPDNGPQSDDGSEPA